MYSRAIINMIWHTMCTFMYKIVNKIGNYLYFYILALIIILVYPEYIANELQSNDPVKRYTPKSKRSTMAKGMSKLVKVLNHRIRIWIQNKTTSWRNTRRLRKLRRASHSVRYTRKRGRNNYPKYNRLKSNASIVAMMATAMQAKMRSSKSARMVPFDVDSYEIGIDNRCSRCISHQADDFIGDLKDTAQSIQSFGGSRITKMKIGTLNWKWMDDKGKVHSFVIPNSFYVPEGGVRLLSPQHWARSTTGNNRKRSSGAGSETLGDKITLFWSNRRYILSVPLCRKQTLPRSDQHRVTPDFEHSVQLQRLTMTSQ